MAQKKLGGGRNRGKKQGGGRTRNVTVQGGGRNWLKKVGRREKLAQKVGRREIYPPFPPPKKPASLTLVQKVSSVQTRIHFRCDVQHCPEICLRTPATLLFDLKNWPLHFILTCGHYVKASQPILYTSNILACFKDTATESSIIFNSFSVDIEKGQVSKKNFSIMIECTKK